MQEKYTLNTALAAVVGLGCLAAVLYRVFLPAAVLPAVGLPAAAACSLLALAARLSLKGDPRRTGGLLSCWVPSPSACSPGPPGSPPGQRPCALPWWAARPSAL
ncbi:MAG: hypothetical protein ACLS63_00565 [Flavonifractor plautii]